LSKQSPKSKPITEQAKTTEILAKNSVVSAETSERKNLIKEITPEEKQKAHREGIIKTIVASALGIIAGLIASSLYGTGENKAWYAILMIVIGFTYFLQKLIYSQLNIDTIEFKFKDWFYVEFIVIDFFLVTWTLLLN
jgi:peroxiredoxin family protein